MGALAVLRRDQQVLKLLGPQYSFCNCIPPNIDTVTCPMEGPIPKCQRGANRAAFDE